METKRDERLNCHLFEEFLFMPSDTWSDKPEEVITDSLETKLVRILNMKLIDALTNRTLRELLG